MAVAEMVLLEPGHTVLDLAASPGGKSTQIASAIGASGLLVANEIHPARIKALGENLERWGTTNTVITNRAPDDLVAIGPAFDRVVIDAPCSGEGLFRRDPAARAQWSPERVRGSADRQRAILASAVALLKPGGVLVYSTCTFNRAENEDVIAELVAGHPELTIDGVTRLWPHEVRGEGHTIHRVRLAGEPVANRNLRDQPQPVPSPAWDRFVAESLLADPVATWGGLISEREGRVTLVPPSALAAQIRPAVRTGLWLGESKPGRFEPAHALALAIDPHLVRTRLDLSVADAHHWIAGEPIQSAGPAGWVLVTVAGFGLGWGKRSGQTVKNHYPKGLRRPTPEK
jgi:NOL1/NOP2/fmu family ribosome biogenesis protein/23S rRNA U2552 (ribose-2'-O)-methylase RlmE/FtsJ